MDRIGVIVLGSTGLVSQRIQERIMHHPWFFLAGLAGHVHGHEVEEIHWRLAGEQPQPKFPNVLDLYDEQFIRELTLQGITVAFSALPSEVAEQVEPLWASHGFTVFSNSSFYRMAASVPFVVPEINPHLLASSQDGRLRQVCATNCTLLPLLLPLAALNDTFCLTKYQMKSEQAISGGGYALIDECSTATISFPYEIEGEAIKTEQEFSHLMNWDGEASLICTRVQRRDGHHVFVTAHFQHPLSIDGVKAALQDWRASDVVQALPSAPYRPLHVVERIDPEIHLFSDGFCLTQHADCSHDLKTGMAVVVGNLELLDAHTLRFQAYSHNAIRGAAGGVVMLAELARSYDRI